MVCTPTYSVFVSNGTQWDFRIHDFYTETYGSPFFVPSCKHTRQPPLIGPHSTSDHHYQLPVEQLNPNCGLGVTTPSHYSVQVESLRTSHLTAAACLPRKYWLCVDRTLATESRRTHQPYAGTQSQSPYPIRCSHEVCVLKLVGCLYDGCRHYTPKLMSTLVHSQPKKRVAITRYLTGIGVCMLDADTTLLRP